MATAEQAGAGASWVPADRLALYRTALQLGLTVQELKGPAPADPPPKPVAASAKHRGLAQTALSIELRGPFEALGRFVTALGRSSAPAWRLLRLELLAGPSAQHRLLLQLEPLPPGAPKLDRRPGSRLPTFSVVHDPFAPVASKPPVMQLPDSAPQGEILAMANPSPAPMPLPWKLELDRPAQPLEAFALRDLFLTGTLRQGSLWLALVRAGGVIHTLRQGEYAGQDLGLVRSVDEEGLELREIVRDGNGHWAESLRRWSVGTRP